MRTNLTTTNARIDALDARLTGVEDGVLALMAHFGLSESAKVTQPKADRKPAKPATRKPAARKAPKKAQPKADLALCKATRVRFIAAAALEGTDFSGCSTKAIAAMCCEDPSLVPAGFRIGDGYAAIYG